MAALDSLPPDQRAVLQLVLRRGRSYEDLAGLLKIAPDAVRDRAHAGVTALAGEGLAEERRGRVADYLLGQLPAAERAEAREELARSDESRAWARSAGQGLAPIAGDALAEIPQAEDDGAPEAVTPAPEAPSPDQPATGTAPLETHPPTAEREPVRSRREGDPPASRLGGLALLAGVAILAAAIVLALVIKRGDSPSTTTTPVGTTPTGAATTPTPGTSTQTATQPIQVLAQINLNAPNGAAKPVGIVQLKRAGNAAAFEAVLQGLSPPTSGFVSLWLTGPKIAPLELVAIDRSKVTSKAFKTFAPVPKNLKPFDTMLVTLQPGSPKQPSRSPGQTLLSGPLRGAAKG